MSNRQATRYGSAINRPSFWRGNRAGKHESPTRNLVGLSIKIVRRRPTLPHRPRCSTIGAGGLNFRVRNVTGCFPTAKTTETLSNHQTAQLFAVRELHSRREQKICGQVLGLLVPVSSTRYRASTSGLSTRSSPGSLTPSRGGRPHLKTSFPLRCFQRLSLPNVANQPCSWRNNWHTRGSSTPVLSY